MDKHDHILVETVEGNLSSGTRHLNGIYTQLFNRRNHSVAHIFQEGISFLDGVLDFGSIWERRGEARMEYMRFVQAGMKEASPWEEMKA